MLTRSVGKSAPHWHQRSQPLVIKSKVYFTKKGPLVAAEKRGVSLERRKFPLEPLTWAAYNHPQTRGGQR